MSRSTPRGLIEARTQAAQLLKDYRSPDPRRYFAAGKRLGMLPCFERFVLREMFGKNVVIRRKHAFHAIAVEWGYSKWEDLKKAFESGERHPDIILSPGMRAFFGVEIRNERMGGESPSTLYSALDSFFEAPGDVLASWFAPAGLEKEVGSARIPEFDCEAAKRELINLIMQWGEFALLDDLLAGVAPKRSSATPKPSPAVPVAEGVRVEVTVTESNPDAAEDRLMDWLASTDEALQQVVVIEGAVEAVAYDPSYEREYLVPIAALVVGGRPALERILAKTCSIYANEIRDLPQAQSKQYRVGVYQEGDMDKLVTALISAPTPQEAEAQAIQDAIEEFGAGRYEAFSEGEA